MRRLWPFGSRPEQSDAELDRETEEARQRHETSLEERRALHDLRRARFLGFWAFALAYCGLFWFVVGAGIWGFISPLIRGIME